MKCKISTRNLSRDDIALHSLIAAYEIVLLIHYCGARKTNKKILKMIFPRNFRIKCYENRKVLINSLSFSCFKNINMSV